MNNILNDPPRMRKKVVSSSPKTDYNFLVEKREGCSKKKLGLQKWRYIVFGYNQEKQGFAFSRKAALVKIRFWIVKQESRRKSSANTSQQTKDLASILGPENAALILSSLERETLRLQELTDESYLFSGSKAIFYGSRKKKWIAGIANKDTVQKIAYDARSRKKAEKITLHSFKQKQDLKEFHKMRESLQAPNP